jgi:hypothetical protein
MKKTLFLIVALGVAASALPLKAVDVYITGSTAFRKQVFTACQKLFVGGAPATTFADAAHGGSSSGSGAGSWCMSGTASNTISILGGGALNVHGLFTGSIQGIQSVENQQPLIWVTPTSTYTTNPPDIAFSDVSSVSTPSYDVNKNPGILPCLEEQVAVQPFVFVKSVVTSGAVTNISNINWEQIRYAYGAGRIPLSSWTSKATDTNTFVYLINRTLDSGTRVTSLSEVQFAYSASASIYNYDPTNHGFYLATNELFSTVGRPGFGVIGASAGNGNANLAWGSGYIAGGDIRTALEYQDTQNQSVGYLSLSDAQTVNTNTGANWKEVISYNGVWPTTDGTNITSGTTTTNNFSPVIYGAYPFWSYEVVVYPSSANNPTIPGCTVAQLGDQNTPGTILGVLDYQTLYSNPGGPTLAGSLENEIELSKSVSPGATAIRLSDMTASRGPVGGTLAPTPNP